jgi:hypothetical protein
LFLVTTSDTSVRELRIQSTSLNEGGVPVQVDLSGSAFDGDTDGDRQTDWHEILCGTDAADRASRLSITETVRQGAAGLVVHWDSVPGHRYQLQATPALGAASWRDVGAPVTAPTARCSQVDPRAGLGRQQFYRVALIE